MPKKYRHQTPEVKSLLQQIKDITVNMRRATAVQRMEMDRMRKNIAHKLFMVAQ